MTGADRFCVVFDCFDTLIHAERSVPTLNELVHRVQDLGWEPHDVVEAVVGEIYAEIAATFLAPPATPRAVIDIAEDAIRRHGVDVPRDVIGSALWDVLGPNSVAYTAIEGARPALAAVRARGHETRVLSNCLLPGAYMRRILDVVGLLDQIDATYFSSDGGLAKPHASAFEIAGRGDFDCRVMVGDQPELDIAPARQLGWDTVLIDRDRPDFSRLFGLLA